MNDSRSPRDRVGRVVRDLPRSGIRDFFELVAARDNVISLGVGEPDFATPWRVREATIFALEHGATSYSSNLGLPQLRRAISSYVKRRTGVEYDPKTEILVTVGVSEALDLAMRALLEPGDEALYHEPSYVSYNPVIRLAGGTPVAVETGSEHGFRVTRARLEECTGERTRLLLLNYPNNPTGAALEPADVAEIAAFARERDLLVLSDEIYGELTYDRDHCSLISQPGMKERTVYLHGMSKAWSMTGYRLGFACAPAELIEAMMKIHQYTMLCAPTPSQKGAIEALENGDEDVESMRAEYRRRRNVMHSRFEAMGLPCMRPDGAFYMMPWIGDTGMTSKEFAVRLLEEKDVAVVPGTAFGECGEGYVRCCFAASMDHIRAALERIEAFLASEKVSQ
ncbi:pyridoxal phosphate-dependent aminotransferase [Kiritimatiella glycovorans]|uniref:Aminotransferase n=1 Tax=Kiritimatiella glycovorans TaxID=1307763 RepID=A0A0G3EIJ1_9BACT|nr:aminotransferase class I/II-fold pyridoxal phosphate-dependent enzyme [Kiritimatiella glycovorans]AKJ65257.1 putative aspartate transaminase [Kiritimatiella glycovorans]